MFKAYSLISLFSCELLRVSLMANQRTDMGRRWKWFLRPGKVAVDLTGQVVPEGNVPGRWRRETVEDVVPEAVETSRCDGAVVYEWPEQRRSAPGPNQRAGRYRAGSADRRGSADD